MFRTWTFKGQEGFTLAALLVILTIIAMIIAFTVPEQWSMIMARDRDRQTIFLMKQYARAIRAWNAKNGGMPTSLDQLKDARRPRVLRGDGDWACPITGKEDDWILVPFGAVSGQGGAGGNPIPGGNPITPGGQQGVVPGQPSKLNKEASPDDYTGPFVGVRPKAKGKSFIEFNGATDYSEWVYTVQDLEMEIQRNVAAASAK